MQPAFTRSSRFGRGFRIGETIYILLWDKTVNFAMRMCDFRCRGLQATEKCNRGLKKKKPVIISMTGLQIYSGGVLLSHDLSVIVSSAQEDFTSVFEMGTGVTPPV